MFTSKESGSAAMFYIQPRKYPNRGQNRIHDTDGGLNPPVSRTPISPVFSRGVGTDTRGVRAPYTSTSCQEGMQHRAGHCPTVSMKVSYLTCPPKSHPVRSTNMFASMSVSAWVRWILGSPCDKRQIKHQRDRQVDRIDDRMDSSIWISIWSLL